ncbi:hypothetical protein AVEN_59176-1 [Araneus ventricosus]|uniref:Uncharacterized protein n=1 Tax=Araneus ventricosus TaxID=182803 RepID=A0A4Y2N066_ARAVE|nr:hypothetical protein AVEN_59176-1 [Araneus ventricosus]
MREGKSHKNLRKSGKWLAVVGIPSGLKAKRKRWSLKSRFRGTLKEASEKNNSLRRLKPRFEGSIYKNLLTGEKRNAIDRQLQRGEEDRSTHPRSELASF